MINLYMALSLTSVILCAVTAIFSVLSYCKVVGLENSTHQVQWMPMETPEKEGDKPSEPSPMVDAFKKHVYPNINDEQV